ncbi:helix-turn-helix domain-containing protein [Arthrobacter sp. ov407]|uniref:helix-turn-helix domain-containing protein n=1 Tax=Arthrobacter sp. ov407 TaxID=1761748 RepID=UPI003525A913
MRLAQNLSQEALGLESGLSRNMIIGIEWGKKSVAYERLWDVADALGVPAADLLSESAALPQRIPYRGGRRAMGAQC